jgi:drug/metabolite transporter (DMT)-like permease
MRGWKTITGAALVAIGGVLNSMPEFFTGQSAIASALLAIGAALGGIGIGNKLDRLVK